MSRSTRVVLALLLTVSLTTACGGTTESATPAAAGSPATETTGPAPDGSTAPTTADAQPTSAAPEGDGECGTVQRAYQTWRGPTPAGNARELTALSDDEAIATVERGEKFVETVRGYDSPEAKVLVGNILVFNMHLASLNLQNLLGSGVEKEAATAAEALQTLEKNYQVWRTKNCP